MAKITISKLKKKLDKIFSIYIRRRKADHLGFVECYTCGAEKHWKEQQAGHFMSRASHSTRWDEINVQVQCVSCNMFKQGNQWKFGQYLDEREGKGTAEELSIKSKQIVKFNRLDYESMIEEYGSKVKELD